MIILTPERRQSMKEYADGQCRMHHGGTLPAAFIHELLIALEDAYATIDDLRRPAVAVPERE